MTSPDPAPTIEAVSEPAAPREMTPLEAALERVGDRWSLLARRGPARRARAASTSSARRSPGIAPNILTDRLRRLERERIVVATPYQERPPRMSYSLTADGRDLASALRLLADWGARGAADVDPMRHGACGTPLQTRWYCPTCETAIDHRDATESRTV